MGCVIIRRGALRAPAGGQRPPLRRSPTVFSPPVSLTADSPLIRGGQRNASTKSLPLTREVARRKPRRRERLGGHMGPPLRILTDGADRHPLIRHLLRKCHLPPRGKVRRVKEAAPHGVCHHP